MVHEASSLAEMRLTCSVILFLAAAGFYYAQAASLASDESNEELNENVVDLSELQKKDQMESDRAEVDAGADEDEDTERKEDQREAQQATDIMEIAEAMEMESQVGSTSQADIDLLCNSNENSDLDEDHDGMRQKREHVEEEVNDEMSASKT